jgi:DNA mismatch repair protein Mlh1 C-terminus
MLAEYFAITISPEGLLTTLPLVLKDYIPPYAKLPTFIRRLGHNVPASPRHADSRSTGSRKNRASSLFYANLRYFIPPSRL